MAVGVAIEIMKVHIASDLLHYGWSVDVKDGRYGEVTNNVAKRRTTLNKVRKVARNRITKLLRDNGIVGEKLEFIECKWAELLLDHAESDKSLIVQQEN